VVVSTSSRRSLRLTSGVAWADRRLATVGVSCAGAVGERDVITARLAALGPGRHRRSSPAIAGPAGRYTRHTASGEINTTVTDIASTLDQVQAHFASNPGASADRLDGLTIHLSPGAWFNLRPSNTEPLLRLNVEAPDTAGMVLLRDEVLSLVRE